MENSRLVELLQTLTASEWRELKKWVKSPFYNLREDVIKLADILEKSLKSGNAVPGKKEIFEKLYGVEMPFDDHKLRMTISFLFQNAERYLVEKEIFGDKVFIQTKLAEMYRRRKLPRHFQKRWQEANQKLENQTHRHATFHNNRYQLQLEEFQFSSAMRRTEDFNLQALSDQLDHTYIAQKLKQICLLLSHQAVYKKDYHFGLLDEILTYVQNQRLDKIPAVGIYYHCYLALQQPEKPELFRHFQSLIFQSGTLFPKSEMRDLFILAINFCIKRYNEGIRSFLQIEFELYREGLRREYLLQEGTLSRFTYRNIVTVALVMKAFDWVEKFINDYRPALEPAYRESTFSFNLARLEYERKNYAQALLLLQKADYEDLLLNLSAKALAMKIYFELGEFDLLHAHLSAMKVFINRKKLIGYHRDNYTRLLEYVGRILELPAGQRSKKTELKKEIENLPAIAEKEWLLAQVS